MKKFLIKFKEFFKIKLVQWLIFQIILITFFATIILISINFFDLKLSKSMWCLSIFVILSLVSTLFIYFAIAAISATHSIHKSTDSLSSIQKVIDKDFLDNLIAIEENYRKTKSEQKNESESVDRNLSGELTKVADNLKITNSK